MWSYFKKCGRNDIYVTRFVHNLGKRPLIFSRLTEMSPPWWGFVLISPGLILGFIRGWPLMMGVQTQTRLLAACLGCLHLLLTFMRIQLPCSHVPAYFESHFFWWECLETYSHHAWCLTSLRNGAVVCRVMSRPPPAAGLPYFRHWTECFTWGFISFVLSHNTNSNWHLYTDVHTSIFQVTFLKLATYWCNLGA